MTEQEWLECNTPSMARYHPKPMLDFLRTQGGERKLRLFALACCDRISHLIPHEAQKLIAAAKLRVDEAVSDEELRQAADAYKRACENAPGSDDEHVSLIAYDSGQAVECALSSASAADVAIGTAEWASMAVADAARNPRNQPAEWEAQAHLLHDIFGNPFRPKGVASEWLTTAVVAIARRMYEEENFTPMPILADALEDAGCADPTTLTHCRGPGPHVRGCWVVDLILKKT